MEPLELRFARGFRVAVVSLLQSPAYDGLIEGYPTAELNAGVIANQRAEFADEPLLVVEPEVTADPSPGEHRPWGPRVALPGWRTVARTSSSGKSESGRWGVSELTVVWFQDEWVPPVAESVQKRLRGTDWWRHAGFEEW